MLLTNEHLANSDQYQDYVDGSSLGLLRELAVTRNVDAALPRLSVFVGRMLPRDGSRVAGLDQRGRRVVNVSAAHVEAITPATTEDAGPLQPRCRKLEVIEGARDDVPEKIAAELHMVGLERFSAAIAQRMKLMETAGRFNDDSRSIRRTCLAVMDRIARTLAPERGVATDADSARDISIAAYLHDIGKSGPAGASQETQEAVARLYAVDNVGNPNQTIGETVCAHFSPDETAGILHHLGSCGVRSTDTMREFWDRHGYWTHDILEADAEDIPIRARVIAGSHHMDRGIDPYRLASDDHVATLESRILMAVDKYQAAVARGQKTHRDAMDVVKAILSAKFGNDVIMNRVLAVLDAVGKEETALAEAA